MRRPHLLLAAKTPSLQRGLFFLFPFSLLFARCYFLCTWFSGLFFIKCAFNNNPCHRCYPPHNSLGGTAARVVIGSTIYIFCFPPTPVGIVNHSTIRDQRLCRGALHRVVIGRTFLFFRSEPRCPSFGCILLEKYAHFLKQGNIWAAAGLLLSAAQFLGHFFTRSCYSQHNFPAVLHTAPLQYGLLFTAHFMAERLHRLISGILYEGLLFSAHFIVFSLPVFIVNLLFFAVMLLVVIDGTFLRPAALFPMAPLCRQPDKGCYPLHNSFWGALPAKSAQMPVLPYR